MGAEMSTRKITIENEDKFIRYTDNIVRRLVKTSRDTETESKEDVKPAAKPVEEVPTPKTPAASPRYPVYNPEMTLSAFEVQQQKEEELETQDQYWQRRLQNLEKNHQAVNRIIKEEYEKAVKEMLLMKQGKKTLGENREQPCTDSSEKVLKCYQEYPKETLKCSSLVEEFSQCVDERRSKVIAARC